MCTMGLGFLFLTVLAMLVSCEDPEGNRVFGGRGAYRVPQSTWLDWSSPAGSKTFVTPLC